MKRKKGENTNQQSNDSKKRPLPAELSTGSGLSEEERLKILEMVENEPEVSDHFDTNSRISWDPYLLCCSLISLQAQCTLYG